MIAQRPFRFGRTLVALTNLHFLREQFAFRTGDEFEPLFAEHGTPELLAEAASTAVALANEVHPLESADFTFPIGTIDVSEDFVSVLRYAAALCRLRETGKLISLLNYELRKVRSGSPRVYRLRAPYDQLDFALRLGFVRGEIGTSASRLYMSRGKPERLHSMIAGAEDLLTRSPQLVELKDPDTPLRRIRLHTPLIPKLWEALSNIRFFEDALVEERLAQELELPMRTPGSGTWFLVPGVDLEMFLRVWRCLQFMAILDLTALRKHQDDPTVVYNSLLRVTTEGNFVDLLKALGVAQEHLPALLGLIAAHVGRLGHYDIQYRPFLRINPTTLRVSQEERTTPPEIVHASGIVAVSNITANVQRAHGIRIKTNADAFVAVVTATLATFFSNVRTNVPLKHGENRTDVDVLLLTEDTAYLIECKHSITPTGAHELRDLWRDINRGVDQLKVATAILKSRLPDYLAGLFPGTTRARSERLRIQPCILTSHRVFSGLAIDGIPIRDWASLALICGDAVVGMGTADGSGQVVMQRYRLRANEQFTQSDLDEYLSESSRFFATFEPFMRECDRLDRLFGGSLMLAYNTYVYGVSQDEWAAHLDRIGCVQVSEERVSIVEPTPIPAVAEEPAGDPERQVPTLEM